MFIDKVGIAITCKKLHFRTCYYQLVGSHYYEALLSLEIKEFNVDNYGKTTQRSGRTRIKSLKKQAPFLFVFMA